MRAWSFLLLALLTPLSWAAPQPKDITFNGTDYFHRWSGDNQHEFTPAAQEDLEKWQDMITLIPMPAVTNADQMADRANAVLGVYKQNGAQIIRTDSEPATDKRPAAYFMMVAIPRPDFIELVFARFKLVDGIGTGAIYSHRIYDKGEAAASRSDAWMRENATATEKALMAWALPAKVYEHH